MRSMEWDMHWLVMAELVASRSKDPSTKVGSVIVSPRNIRISDGYNGFPQRIKDDDRLNDRLTKYRIMIHAELNALLFARCDLTDHTLYTWPFSPCDRCAPHVIQSGISRVVAPTSNEPRWEESLKFATNLFLEAGMEVTLYG